MIIYGIGMLPLTRSLKGQIKDLLQPWYADDAAAGGKFEKILEYYKLLYDEGPGRGYFPEPTKSILVVKPQSVERATALFQHLGFKIVTGTRYLGGHIGDEGACTEWIESKVAGWVAGIKSLSKMALCSPQCAFAGLQKSLQSEWMHLQRSIGGLGPAFAPVEDAISSCFLPALIGKDPESPIPADLRRLLSLPVKHAGIGVPDPTASAANHHATSTECTSLLTSSLLGHTTFNLADHKSTMQQGRSAAKLASLSRSDASLTDLTADMPKLRLRKVTRNRETGAWLNIIPTIVNGLSLSKMEFRDGLRMRYGIGLENLPYKCDGCGAKFTPTGKPISECP